MLDLSVIIVSFNTKELLKNCIESVVKNTFGIKYEVVIVDNGSKDGSVEFLKTLVRTARVKIILNKANIGFGGANNKGLRNAMGEYVLLLNSDTVIHNNVLGEMVEWMRQNTSIGVSSCALKNSDGSIQGTGGYFPTLIRVFSWMTIQDFPFVDKLISPFHPMHDRSFSKGDDFYKKERELDWVTGAYMLIRKKTLNGVGYFDSDYFMYTEEVDLCYRIKRAGWKIIYLPKWCITHLSAASSSKENALLGEYKGVKTFYKKHYPSWQYPLLRILLKIGALGRMVLFGLLNGRGGFITYVRAFEIA